MSLTSEISGRTRNRPCVMRFPRICRNGVLYAARGGFRRSAPRAGSRRYVIVPAKRIAAAGKNECHDTFVSALGNARVASG